MPNDSSTAIWEQAQMRSDKRLLPTSLVQRFVLPRTGKEFRNLKLPADSKKLQGRKPPTPVRVSSPRLACRMNFALAHTILCNGQRAAK